MARAQKEIGETAGLPRIGTGELGIKHLSDPTNVHFSMLNSYSRQRLNSQLVVYFPAGRNECNANP